MPESLFNVLFPIYAGLSYLALAAKLRDLARDPGDRGLAAMCAARASAALAATVMTPAVYVRLDRLAGVPNLAALLFYLMLVLNAGTMQLAWLHILHPPARAGRATRWLVPPLCLTLAIITALFLLAPVGAERPVDFDVYYAQEPAAAAFLLVAYGCFGLGLFTSARNALRHAAAAGNTWLGRGLRVAAASALCSLFGFAGVRAAAVVALWLDHDVLVPWSILWAPISLVMSASITVIAVLLPALGPGLASWIGRFRAYRRLHPLWLALYRATPEIALNPPARPGRSRTAVRDLDFRLYRRVIEIRDGRLALRPLLDSGVAEQIRRAGREAGLTGTDLAALVEAATLAAALAAKAAGRTVPPDRVLATAEPPDGSSLSGELGWLLLVADAFNRSPLVAAARSGRRPDRPVEIVLEPT